MASTISAGTTAGTALNMTGDTTGNLAFQTGAGANTITVPNGTGTIAVNGVSTNIVSGTAVASTSGTSIDFTSVPSWVKRITVMFSGVSTNGTSIPQVQLGTSSGVKTTGYSSNGVTFNSNSAINGSEITTGFATETYNPYFTAAAPRNGQMIISLLGSNIWVSSTSIGTQWSGTSSCSFNAGVVTLAATLDRVRITTVNGTDTFDAGSINILYE
jgi:hypothetical protein